MFPANELWGNQVAKCPYCKAKQCMDDWNSGHDEIDEYECEDCEKKFLIRTRHEIEYDSVGDCQLNGQMPHQLVKGPFSCSPFECIKCCQEFYDWQLADGRYPKIQAGEYEILEREPEEFP